MIKKTKTVVIESSKKILGGVSVFKGTRVPVHTLIDYIEAGDSISDFLDDFPTVTEKQVSELLGVLKKRIARG